MSGRKTQIPPVHKRLLSMRWYRKAVDSEPEELARERENLKNGNVFRHHQQKREEFGDRNNGGLTKEQVNFLVFRAGRGMPDGIFSGTEEGSFFPDIAPRVEHFMEDDIRQIRCMLAQGYRSYEVDKPSAWKMLYYAELLLKGYTLRRLITRGDFGVVYSAACHGANCKARVAEEIAKDGATRVGIKIIDKSDTHWYQVRNEIAAHATTSGHPNVLKLYQVFHTATATYLVQEFSGARGSLESVVPRNGFSEDDCRNLMGGILLGLRHLQRLDVVHRNLTCANILLTSQGTVKIAEFGLACVLPEQDFLLYQKVGTSGYMAPEILRGLRYNGFLSDIWSIGIVLYFLLHKFLPFTDEDLTLYNCWHCLDFTHRSLSVDLCLLLRSILQFRPTARPSIDSILRHDWLAQVPQRLVQSEVKASAVPRESVQPEHPDSGSLDPHHSWSVQSVQEKQKDEVLSPRKDLGRCWASLKSCDGQNNERVTLKSRLISQSQQNKMNRLERKVGDRKKGPRKSTRPSLKGVVLPELVGLHRKKQQQQAGDPINVQLSQVPSAPILSTSDLTETSIDDVVPLESDPGDGGRGKGVYCTSMRCLREIQQMRRLFEASSGGLKSPLTISVPSVSEDDEDNDKEDRKDELRTTDKEPEAMKLDEEANREKDDDRKATTGEDERVIGEDVSGKTEQQSLMERRTMTIDRSRSTDDEDAAPTEDRLSGEKHSQLTRSRSKEQVASAHQMKEVSSEQRLIASIRNLKESTTPGGSFSAPRSSHRRNDENATGGLVGQSEHGIYAALPSLDAVHEVPAEYAAGLDVEDEEIEHLIKTQYYNQLDLPSEIDDPLEAEANALHRVNSNISSEATNASPQESLVSTVDDVRRPRPDGGASPTYDTVAGWVQAIRSGSMASDSSSGLFHPELAFNWEAVSRLYAGSDPVENTPLRETKTKSRTTVVSRAPSLRGITEELHAAAEADADAEAEAGGGGVEFPAKSQTQESLRKTISLGKRTTEGFPGKAKSKDFLQSSSSSSVRRLQTQSQLQIQEERSESATWESISARGISRGSYPKLAASIAIETSLHSIVELRVEKDVENLEQDNNT